MIAKKKNNQFTVYNDDNNIIGHIRLLSDNYMESEILVEDKSFHILRHGWKFEIKESGETILNLKTNSFLGDITAIEINKKIKGVFSLKWGTQMVDEDNNTLLKIRNENLLINDGKYIIELVDQNINNFDVLLSLFGHLYSSRIKTPMAF